MEYLLRAMTLEDIPQIVKIEEETFPTPWSDYAFRCELNDNEFANYLVVVSSDAPTTVLGYGGMWLICDEAHITNIAISSSYRGRGLGNFLLEGLVLLAKAKNALRMTLEARVSNKIAINLYENLDFVSAGIRPGYYADNNEDALIMWKEIT